jgi:HEAT repeat protein
MRVSRDVETINEHILNLTNKDELIRENSAYMLGEIAAELVSITRNTLKDDAQLEKVSAMHSQPLQRQAVSALVAAMADNEPWVRGNAVEALGKIGDILALPDIIIALEDSDQVVRATAAEALGAFRDTRSEEELKKALSDQEWSVRLNAVKSLGKIGDKAVIDVLKPMKNDSNHDVRIKLREAVQMINDNSDVLPDRLSTHQVAGPS